jgi:hypothetical protein
MVNKTIYESFGKVVLESGNTGIMISTEEYSIYERAGLSDGKIFDFLRWE